jgi:6-pyruvoyltetrahydropterin/6-carboxytetrahydropterin synthase
MHFVVKRLHFCYGHRLLEYEGKCAHPHGHNAVVDIELAADHLDKIGMVRDFSDISEIIGGFIEENIDHKMLLRRDDPITKLLLDLGEPVYIMDRNPTAENIAEMIFHYAREQGLPVSAIRLWETKDAYAEYRPGSEF